MKKLFAIATLGLLSFSAAHAQENDKMLFNHLAVGITTGTPGLIGFDIATTCTPYLQIRAGLAIMPKFKYNTDIHVNANEYNNKINDMYTELSKYGKQGMMENPDGTRWSVAEQYAVQGKMSFTNGKFLIDIFPFKSTGFPFFITVGAYFGGRDIVSVYNKDDGALAIVNKANDVIAEYNKVPGVTKVNSIAATVGEYTNLGPDVNGNVRFDVKVSGFKPYLGIGFGRPFPRKKRIGFSAEIGCMFWRTPVVTFTGNDSFEIDRVKAGKENVGKAIDIVSKFSAWPCLNFRLTGKIF